MTDSDVREEIMRATYEALCEHGYSELTAQSIADRTDKSKSLLFYHYDSKEELVADFVDYLVDWFDERALETVSLSPVERLATIVDWFLYGSSDDHDERESFHTAMLELRTQAPYHEPYRANLRKSDDYLRNLFEEILQDGIEAGQFVDHDTEEMATLLMATLDGARIRQLTLDRDSYVGQVRSAAVDRIFDDILADEVEFPDRNVQWDNSTVSGLRKHSDRASEADANVSAERDGSADSANDTGSTERDTGSTERDTGSTERDTDSTERDTDTNTSTSTDTADTVDSNASSDGDTA
ncbi:TetR family transcriptional regulator [Natrialba chahannaoensis JCM 10990]|uniref:TetR family transcriptional regulator n=1 Tax=Natrialba chahannaoensis JCM 10990 TaxID=1227492 RepID=M0ASL6_9EURY|nr:TetR/AcrR family transcriptional regulator [Natrialba chahannaoensis]ELZ01505.1 TetR family transcriptional regulator [Natrialba chahannaoensis JCM 10990]